MLQFIVTLALVAVPYFLLLYLAAVSWNGRTRKDAVTFTVVIVVATLLWQGCWDAAGGVL